MRTRFDPLNPVADAIRLEDIARNLSRIPRFNGDTTRFYSVAEHSIGVSAISDHPAEALMHDAAEAYLGDLVRPLLPSAPRLVVLHRKVHRLICERFDLDPDYDYRREDDLMLHTEMRDVWLYEPSPWNTPLLEHLDVYTGGPEDVESRFLSLAIQLGLET